MTDAESILAYLDRLLLSAYATPYLTCGQCNSLNFIDVAQIQGIRNDVRRTGEYERLVPCVGCGRTIFLRPGVASLAAEIEHKTLQDDSHEKKRAPAAIHIQRVARGYLGRMEAKARRQAKLEWERKIFCAAACIQRRIRGVEARTRYRIEQCIAVILNSHKAVYAFATTNQPNAPRIFWYESAAELAVFRTDYREFVRRTGNRPPLHRVEANVQEVTRRVLARENRLVARIQAAWRGLTTRVAYLELKRQLGWHRSSRMAPAVRIQRLARMHADRRRRPAPVPSRDACLADYSTIYTEKTRSAHARHLQRTLLATYRDRVQHKRGAKLVGLPIEPFRVYKKGAATLLPHGNSNSHPQSNNTVVKTKTTSAFLLAKAKLDRHPPASLPQRLRQQVTNQRSDPYD